MNDLTKKDFIEKYKDGKFDFAVQNTCRAVEYATWIFLKLKN